MYVLALDESGTHNEAPVLLLAGLAVHESDVRRLEEHLEAVLQTHLPTHLAPISDYEIHATELKTPTKGRPATSTRRARRPSEWLAVDSKIRLAILHDAYEVISGFVPSDPAHPPRMLAAIIDRSHGKYGAVEKADAYAYEHVVHRFDELLRTILTLTDASNNKSAPDPERGLILHDRRLAHERRIQQQTALWQRQGTGLSNLIQVPLFVDSRASRLIQAADLVAYALWRQYQPAPDRKYAAALWPIADRNQGGEMTGVIHVTPFPATCHCPPCTSRHSPAPLAP